jgi:hypothetical protein
MVIHQNKYECAIFSVAYFDSMCLALRRRGYLILQMCRLSRSVQKRNKHIPGISRRRAHIKGTNLVRTGFVLHTSPRECLELISIIKHVKNGVRDQIENYNGEYCHRSRSNQLLFITPYCPLVNRDVTKRRHPESLRPFLTEISAFARHNHFKILCPILQYVPIFSSAPNECPNSTRLVARGLELPENTLVNTHSFDGDAVNETYVRFMK